MIRLFVNALVALALCGLSMAPVQASRIMKPDQNTFLKGVEPGVPAASGPVAVTHRSTAYFGTGYGSGPATLSGVTISSGDKVVVFIHNSGNGAQTVTGLTANSGAITFTQICVNPNWNDRLYVFYADTTGVTNLDLSATLSGSSRDTGFSVVTLTGAASGSAVSCTVSENSITNPDPIDVDNSLSAPTNGALLVSVWSGTSSSGHVYTGATEIGSVVSGGDELSVASQTTAGNVSILGQPSGGPGYGGLLAAAVTFQP